MNHDRFPHWRAGLVSVIIPVLELKRPLRLRNPLATRRGLADLLDDLEESKGADIEIIVVCNSQDDDLVDLVATDSRIDKYCLNSDNVGVARGWNMGAMLAEGEYLCFINDDVALGSGGLAGLASAMKDNPSVGQAGPRGAMWPGLKPGPYVGEDKPELADAISGFCFITRRQVFDFTGGFDVSFTPAGCEEIDYSFAVRAAGYSCLVVPGLDIVHHGHAGVSSRETVIRYLGSEAGTTELAARNLDIFQKKWGRS